MKYQTIMIALMLCLISHIAFADLIVTGKLVYKKGAETSTIELDTDGNIHVSGKGIKIDGNMINTPSGVIDISAENGIVVTNQTMVIQGSNGDVYITKNPQIAPGFDGQVVVLFGNDDTKKVKIENGNGVKLRGGVEMWLGNLDHIELTYFNSSSWNENNRGDK